MKQTIKVVLARTNWDGAMTAWQELKTVTIQVEKKENEPNWHVIGGMTDEVN